MRFFSVFVATVGFALLAGCNKNEPVNVSGNVTIDGQPLPEGQIVFEAADGNGPPATGSIKAGQYTLKSAPGAKKVKITASRPVPGAKKDETMGLPPQVQYLAAEYNSNTKLTTEVKPGKDANVGVNFEVKGPTTPAP